MQPWHHVLAPNGLILSNITRQELAREAIASSVEKKRRREGKEKKEMRRKKVTVFFLIFR